MLLATVQCREFSRVVKKSKITSESRKSPPRQGDEVAAPGPLAPPPQVVAKDPWMAVTDQQTRQVYWWNTASNETTHLVQACVRESRA